MVHPLPRLSDGRTPVVTSGFGERGDRFHGGDDIMYHRVAGEPTEGPHGTPNFFMPDRVYAMAVSAGVVESSQERFDTLTKPGTPLSRGWGVVIRHDAGYTTFSNHGKLGTALVRAGQRVREGQRIFEVGASFGNQGPKALMHLHFELWPGGTQASRIDPAAFLAGLPIVRQGGAGGLLWPVAAGVGLVLLVKLARRR